MLLQHWRNRRMSLRVFQWTSSEEGLQISQRAPLTTPICQRSKPRGDYPRSILTMRAHQTARSFWCLHEQLSSVDELHNFPLYSRGEQCRNIHSHNHRRHSTLHYHLELWRRGNWNRSIHHHTYASAQSFTVTENVTDSSTPPQTTTSSQTITVKTTSGGTSSDFRTAYG